MFDIDTMRANVAKGTPGEFVVNIDGTGDLFVSSKNGGKFVCDVGADGEEFARADARRLASVPAMEREIERLYSVLMQVNEKLEHIQRGLGHG